ncbi:hypothetical protein GCM10025858_01070 [Alicyclobacillus sacchari]|nr:hypothetical protein GCM10025858_01070 [Alicyclobacillus sacchari]
MLHPHGLFWLHPILVCVIIAALALALLNFGNVKRIVVGKPIRSRELHGSKLKLTWWIALPYLRPTCIRPSRTVRKLASPNWHRLAMM